jgi:SHS2 domain-containing protein
VVPHEFFSHTGDIGVRIRAETVDRLFAEAVVAFTDVLTDPAAVRAISETRLAMESTDLDLLLHDFLSELLYGFDAKRRVPALAACEITRAEHGWHLDARVMTEDFDPARHAVRVLIKGVTYHGLTVRQEPEGWMAEIVFDI